MTSRLQISVALNLVLYTFKSHSSVLSEFSCSTQMNFSLRLLAQLCVSSQKSGAPTQSRFPSGGVRSSKQHQKSAANLLACDVSSSGRNSLKARAVFITFAPATESSQQIGVLSFLLGRIVHQTRRCGQKFSSLVGGGGGPGGQISLVVWYRPFLHAAWFTRADSILICMHTRANNGPAQRERERERSCYGVALRAERLLLLFSWIARSENKQNARWCGSWRDTTYAPSLASAFSPLVSVAFLSVSNWNIILWLFAKFSIIIGQPA